MSIIVVSQTNQEIQSGSPIQMKRIKTKHLDPAFRRAFVNELESRLLASARRGETPEYIDTILSLCEIHQIEPEVVSSMIPVSIKDKIKVEAIDRNLLPKETQTEIPLE